MMARRKPGSLRDERGSNLAEFALSVSLFLLMLLGVMESGRMLYTYHFVSYAARDGARYAIVRGAYSGTPASATDIQNYVQQDAVSGIDPNSVTVTTTWTPDNNPGSVVQVKVSYNYQYLMPILSGTFAMTSTAQMVISQ